LKNSQSYSLYIITLLLSFLITILSLASEVSYAENNTTIVENQLAFIQNGQEKNFNYKPANITKDTIIIISNTTSHYHNEEEISLPTTYDNYIISAAEKYNIHHNLIHSIIKHESNYDPKAVSRAGAQGLMQLMPKTAAGLGVNEPFDPKQNIEGGTRYLSYMLERYNGDIVLALAAYNAGPGNVDKYSGIPPFEETKKYIDKVMTTYNQLK
jgi:soluble lytic murein transglycosylase-like protein